MACEATAEGAGRRAGACAHRPAAGRAGLRVPRRSPARPVRIASRPGAFQTEGTPGGRMPGDRAPHTGRRTQAGPAGRSAVLARETAAAQVVAREARARRSSAPGAGGPRAAACLRGPSGLGRPKVASSGAPGTGVRSLVPLVHMLAPKANARSVPRMASMGEGERRVGPRPVVPMRAGPPLPAGGRGAPRPPHDVPRAPERQAGHRCRAMAAEPVAAAGRPRHRTCAGRQAPPDPLRAPSMPASSRGPSRSASPAGSTSRRAAAWAGASRTRRGTGVRRRRRCHASIRIVACVISPARAAWARASTRP